MLKKICALFSKTKINLAPVEPDFPVAKKKPAVKKATTRKPVAKSGKTPIKKPKK